MPTLNWIGKEAVVKHHQDVPYRLLEPVPELSLPVRPERSGPVGREVAGHPGNADCGGNLIVQGDNLHALKALLPRYAGQVKCIYIDPPYNTGNEGWVYNDNVNSPEIRKWLGEVVGREGETLDRHDRWLCMMYPRLMLLRQFLRDDGAIFVSIDDNEVAALRLVMDEIFGERNFVANIVWHNSSRIDDYVSVEHEYVLVYFKSKSAVKTKWKRERSEAHALLDFVHKLRDEGFAVEEAEKELRNKIQEFKVLDKRQKTKRFAWLTNYSNLDEHWRIYYPVDLSGEGDGPPRHFKGKLTPAPKGRHWMSQEYIDELDAGNRIVWRANRAYRKLYIEESEENLKGMISLPTRNGGEEIKRIFGKQLFDKPKPYELIQELTRYILGANDIVLDSFAGSGTTAHAALKQNTEDGGQRRFILVEIDEGIARNVTAERVKRVAQGYTNIKGEKVEGLGGGFQFCRLSAEPLFDANGQVRADVTFAQLAEFVWFRETGIGLPPHPNPLPPGERGLGSPLIGVHEGRAVYLLYNGILKDKSVNGGNVLTSKVLETLPAFDGPKVIYAAACRLGEPRLRHEGIVFKQTPYALAV
ncbi:MAG: site-specific DNA-methyltransferase [Gammaproteobacteria bacterium]